MNIYIDGVNTENKGAEIMLYAILNEIEKKYPNANILLPTSGFPLGLNVIETKLNLRYRESHNLYSIFNWFKGPSILRRLNLQIPAFSLRRAVKNIDILFDASGLGFSDSNNTSDQHLKIWENYWRILKNEGTKMIYLPQSYGPFNTKNSKKIVQLFSKYTDIVFARESVSYNHLRNTGYETTKLFQSPDFTATVKGYVPIKYDYLKNYVCFIPNMRMTDKGQNSLSEYLNFCKVTINKCQQAGYNVFLLNHEYKGDEQICKMINREFNNKLKIISRENGLVVKGLISISHAVITSRYHGVASALNSCVPCLATSWNHKYETLLNQYDIEDGLMNVIKPEKNILQLEQLLDKTSNLKMRQKLQEKNQSIIDQIYSMWEVIWERLDN